MKCTALTNRKSRCQNHAMPGYKFCRLHCDWKWFVRTKAGTVPSISTDNFPTFKITKLFCKGYSVSDLTALVPLSEMKTEDVLRFEMKARRPV